MLLSTDHSIYLVGGGWATSSNGNLVFKEICPICGTLHISDKFEKITEIISCNCTSKPIISIKTLNDQLNVDNYKITAIKDQTDFCNCVGWSYAISLVSAFSYLYDIGEGIADSLVLGYCNSLNKRKSLFSSLKKTLVDNRLKSIGEILKEFRNSFFASHFFLENNLIDTETTLEKDKDNNYIFYNRSLKLPIVLPGSFFDESFREKLEEVLAKPALCKVNYKTTYKRVSGDKVVFEKDRGICGKCGVIVMKKEIKDGGCPNCGAEICK